MKTIKISKIILAVLMLSQVSCVEKTSNKKSSSTQTSTISTTATDPASNDTPDVVEDPSLPNYYSLNVILHGTPPSSPGNGVYWSSDENIPSNDQYIFQTDSRMNVRIKALASPTKFSTDSNGIECSQYALGYTKLNVDICIRSASGICVYEHSFTEIGVNSYSPVKEYTVPSNTNEPLVVEVNDVRWNYYTLMNPAYIEAGYPEMMSIGYLDCIKFQIEFSTDETKDLPGSRY